jgi:SET domain-containing protein
MKRAKPRRRFVARASQIHQRGVFAEVPIKRGTRLIEYTGERISHAQASRRYRDDDSTHTFLFALDDEVIDATHGGNSSRWINHSCAPNCESVEVDGRVFIEAIRDIRPGDELTYDYRMFLEERHTPALKREFRCNCGARRCRGTLLFSKR